MQVGTLRQQLRACCGAGQHRQLPVLAGHPAARLPPGAAQLGLPIKALMVHVADLELAQVDLLHQAKELGLDRLAGWIQARLVRQAVWAAGGHA